MCRLAVSVRQRQHPWLQRQQAKNPFQGELNQPPTECMRAASSVFLGRCVLEGYDLEEITGVDKKAEIVRGRAWHSRTRCEIEDRIMDARTHTSTHTRRYAIYTCHNARSANLFVHPFSILLASSILYCLPPVLLSFPRLASPCLALRYDYGRVTQIL